MRQGTLVARELLSKGLWKCPRCKETKVLEASFYHNKASRTGYSSHCVICMNEIGKTDEAKAWNKQNHQKKKSKRRDYLLKRSFGISLADYDLMYQEQEGKCAICSGVNSDRTLAVDHNHTTGKVRALLCSCCNAAIGFLKEDVNRALRAIDYLRRYN